MCFIIKNQQNNKILKIYKWLENWMHPSFQTFEAEFSHNRDRPREIKEKLVFRFLVISLSIPGSLFQQESSLPSLRMPQSTDNPLAWYSGAIHLLSLIPFFPLSLPSLCPKPASSLPSYLSFSAHLLPVTCN